MIEIKSPNRFTTEIGHTLFLGGGISGCQDWQRYAVDSLIDADLIIFNPRRDDFSYSRSNEFRQVNWEYEYLASSDAIVFWFPYESVCPITLLEYGKYLMTNKRLFVGTHPSYAKRLNLQIQTRLSRPDIIIRDCLDDVIQDVKNWSRSE